MLLASAGCSGKARTENDEADGQQSGIEADESAEEEVQEDTQLYILLYSNTDTRHIFLESVDTGRQEEFEYNGGTYVYSRYGGNMTISQLQVGELVKISYTEEKLLTEVNVSEDTFLYDGITNFSVDSAKEILSVADSKYYYNESLKIFSDNGIISLNELSEKNDTICIRGQGKEILTLVVTTGHGTVALKNTKDFEGGMITIGNVVAQEISEDLVLEIPEGTYTLSAANDGYGGSKEVTVNRFEELTVDLNTLKGEGPSYCMMKISPEPENARVTIDGADVDCSQLLELKYGVYRLAAEADGYESWSGRLVVSSKEASITIELEKASDESEEENTAEDGTQTAAAEETSSPQGTDAGQDTKN